LIVIIGEEEVPALLAIIAERELSANNLTADLSAISVIATSDSVILPALCGKIAGMSFVLGWSSCRSAR
jgi:hypothetical protein